MARYFQTPWLWTPGDTITSARLNKYTNNDLYFKEKIEELGVPVGEHRTMIPIDHPDQSVSPPKLRSVNELQDNYVPVYDGGSKKFKWRPYGYVPSADVGYELWRLNGIYYEQDNWLPEGCVENESQLDGKIIWNTDYALFSTGLHIGAGSWLRKAITVTPEAIASWDVRRYLTFAVRSDGWQDARVWLQTGIIFDIEQISNKNEHVGFFISDGNVYASCADGEYQTTLLIAEGLEDFKYYKFGISLYPGHARFYINDELKGEITTNVPFGYNYAQMLFGASLYTVTAAEHFFYLYNTRFYQDGTPEEIWEEHTPGIKELKVWEMQIYPAYGTFSEMPENLNDKDTYTLAGARYVDDYAEIKLKGWRKFKQFRMFGCDMNAGDGRWKLQYYDGTWHDWITDIPVRKEESWSDWVEGDEVVGTHIRLVNTQTDTGVGMSYIGELEVKY